MATQIRGEHIDLTTAGNVGFNHDEKSMQIGSNRIERSMETLKTKFVTSKNMKKPSIVPVPLNDPRPEQSPFVVDLMWNILDVSEFNAEEFTAKINIEMVYFWEDPRLIGRTQEDLDWSETWCPRPWICNCGELEGEDPDCVIQDSSTGLCKATCTLRGFIKNRMDLHEFPFDQDSVELRFDFQRQGLPANQAVLRYPCKGGPLDKAGFKPTVQDVLCLDLEFSAVTAWNVLGYGAYARTAQYKQAWSQCVLCVYVSRVPLFYMTKVALLIVMSSLMSFGVYNIDEIGDKMAYLVTVFIANGALLFISSGSMPKTPYLTALDKVVLVGFLMVFVVFVHNYVYVTKEVREVMVLGRVWQNIHLEAIVLAIIYIIASICVLVGPMRKHRRAARETEELVDIQVMKGSLERCLNEGIYLKRSEMGDIFGNDA